MTRTIAAVICACGASVALAAAQQTPQQTPQSPSTQQTQAQKQSVSLSGCVYQASDEPTMFALRRGNGDKTSQADEAAKGKQTSPTKPEQAAAVGTAGAGRAGEGAWYRLTPEATQNLKQYVGKAVRVTGNLLLATLSLVKLAGLLGDVGANQLGVFR